MKPKDKRTKEWKIYKANFENKKGLGDIVEDVLKATGVKKVVELFTNGLDCGCDERKEALNKIKLIYRMQRCFTEDLYNKWTIFRERPNKEQVTAPEQHLIIEVTAHLFARSFKFCSRCGNAVFSRIKEIDKIYDKYQ